MSRTALAVLGLTLASGCTVHDYQDIVMIGADVQRVVVSADVADVSVITTIGPPVLAWRYSTYDRKPDLAYWLVDDEFQVTFDCPLDALVCRGELELRIPAKAGAFVSTSSGGIEVRGLAGAVELKSASGDIDLRRIGGTIDVSTGSGSIDGHDLNAPVVVALSSSGAVTLEHDSSFELIDVQTASGDIELRVPHGSYTCFMDSDSGQVEARGIIDVYSSDHVIDLYTSSGDIELVGY